jgi:hypothetical protein
LTAWNGVPCSPNMIVDFGGGREFIGAQDRMQHLLRLWEMWRGGGAGAELWDATAEVDGLPLYQRPSRIPSRPGATLIGFLLGLLAALYAIWGSAAGNPDSSFIVITGATDALVVLFYLFILTQGSGWCGDLSSSHSVSTQQRQERLAGASSLCQGPRIPLEILFYLAKGYPGWARLGLVLVREHQCQPCWSSLRPQTRFLPVAHRAR